MLGFTASALLRLSVGLAFCAAATALVWAVERPSRDAQQAATAPAAAIRHVRLTVEATYPVERWQVSVLGAPMTADRAERSSWSGTVAGPAGEQVLVVATGIAAGEPGNRCLRLRVDDGEERFVWGSGDVTATVALP